MSASPFKVHPITGAVITPLFADRHGRNVWPIMGGSETPPEAPPPGDGTPEPPGGDKGDKGDPPPAEWDGKVESLPPGAQDYIRKLTGENAEKRTAARDAEEKANEKIKAALSALGVDVGKKDDPVQIAQRAAAEATAKAEAAAAEVRNTKAELVVWRAAAELKVNAGAVTDSRSFERAIGNLDPASDTFDADVRKAAQEAAKNNPALQAPAAKGKGGAEFNGGTGEGAKKATSLEEAIAAQLGA